MKLIHTDLVTNKPKCKLKLTKAWAYNRSLHPNKQGRNIWRMFADSNDHLIMD